MKKTSILLLIITVWFRHTRHASVGRSLADLRCRGWLAGMVAALTLFTSAAANNGGETGFLERFGLADDREAVLETLVPGSRDYYYYHVLHFQNSDRLHRANELLTAWKDRHESDGRRQALENRQVLLAYPENPAASLEELRRKLNPDYSHRRDDPAARPEYPTALDPASVTRDAFFRAGLSQRRDNVAGFEPGAHGWLLQRTTLRDAERRDLLNRLEHPDHPGLVRHLAADLDHRRSRGFGDHEVHRQLTLEQLEELRELKPDLIHDATFLRTWLHRLRPGPDIDPHLDLEARRDYLERLWAFARDLPESRNSIKLAILYERLKHDRRLGTYDLDRFMDYIRIPRPAEYVNTEWFESRRRRSPESVAEPDASLYEVLAFDPIRHDEALVRDILSHFFRSEDLRERFREYLQQEYLNRVFAEARLLAGVGDPETLYSLLDPNQVEALRERVDVRFAHENPGIFHPDDSVALDVHLKNVEELRVRVYRINEENYYREEGEEVRASIPLDGLVPHEEFAYEYDEPPIRRVRRTLEPEGIDGPGMWLVELVGDGKSTRALVRKGQLYFTEEQGAGGHVFRVYDQDHDARRDARLIIDEREYRPDENGRIVVSYTADEPKSSPVVVIDGDRASLGRFLHRQEVYQLDARFHVEAEMLGDDHLAKLVVRPALRVNGARLPLELLENVRLSLETRGIGGASGVGVEDGFALNADGETAYEFRVPPGTRNVAVELTGHVQSLSAGETVTLTAEETFEVNEPAESEKLAFPYLTRGGGGYVLEIRGRNGELLSGRSVRISAWHRDVKTAVSRNLQSDAGGRVELGKLPEIRRIEARVGGHQQEWQLETALYTYPEKMTAAAGETIRLPWTGESREPDRFELGLLELRDGRPSASRFGHLSIAGGYLEIEGLPSGRYRLLLKELGREVNLRVIEGRIEERTVHGNRFWAERSDPEPATLLEPEIDNEKVRLRLRHSAPDTRVHLFASRYVSGFHAGETLGYSDLSAPDERPIPGAGTDYLPERRIGDEYRYVLERRSLPRFPGIPLERPGLILNPREVRETETGEQVAVPGETVRGPVREDFRLESRRQMLRRDRPAVAYKDPQLFRFLRRPALALTNLRPDDEGVIELDREIFADRHLVRVVVADGDKTLSFPFVLGEPAAESRDRRLAEALDPDGHFVPRDTIEVLGTGDSVEVPRLAGVRLEVYDSLASVYSFFRSVDPALSGENNRAGKDGGDRERIDRFAWLVHWHAFDRERKLEKYAEFASHELHFFLYRKDPDFFDAIVRPYLENKHHKTFLDRYFLGEDLGSEADLWAFDRLNAVERVLLGERLDRREAVAGRFRDRLAVAPPDPERENRLFDTALDRTALVADPVGLARMELMEPADRDAPQRARVYEDAPEAEADELRTRRRAVLDDRARVRQLFRDVRPTVEWAETHYFERPLKGHTHELVPISPFWADYVSRDNGDAFLSEQFIHASSGFTDMMMALAVLDLPFQSGEHEWERPDEGPVVFTAGSPAIAVYRRIEPARPEPNEARVLVSQNFFEHGDRYRTENGERRDRFVSEEFLTHTVYGAEVVVTNPSSSPRRIEVLLQIPEGALPVLGGHALDPRRVELDAYDTVRLNYYFYFPDRGDYPHFPAHVAAEGRLLAFADPVRFNVVDERTEIDRESWHYVSQHGTGDEVIAFLGEANLEAIDLEMIAWRMEDRSFFGEAVDLLRDRLVYDNTLWAYSLKHDRPEAIREFLTHQDGFTRNAGTYVDSPILRIDPVERFRWEFLEYAPFINARAHRLGGSYRIVNDAIYEQYTEFLDRLAYQTVIDAPARMEAVYYLLLQDRVAEAIEHFERVASEQLETRLQHDYFRAYLAVLTGEHDTARAIAEARDGDPVTRWRGRFNDVLAYLDQAEGRAPVRPLGRDERTRLHEELAGEEPSLNVHIEGNRLHLSWENLEQVHLNAYPMDAELLFSHEPFVDDYVGGHFRHIDPMTTLVVDLPETEGEKVLSLPDTLPYDNAIVEVKGGALTRTVSYFANGLDVRLRENYGLMEVRMRGGEGGYGGAYVKVYARTPDGEVRFHKDGYTDLRGRFDYASVSGDRISPAELFSILILSEEHGAEIKRATPPAQ